MVAAKIVVRIVAQMVAQIVAQNIWAGRAGEGWGLSWGGLEVELGRVGG